jgi:hypothetical protein
LILGFAHISIGVAWGGESTYPFVVNSVLKWPFMHYEADSHSIHLLNGGAIPLELVRYDTGFCKGRSRLGVVGKSHIMIKAGDTKSEIDFLLGLGGAIDGGEVAIDGLYEKWDVRIRVVPVDVPVFNPYLDIVGYQSIAFYSSNIHVDRDALIAAGGQDATIVFPVDLGRKTMNVCMMRSPEGTIVELVGINKDDY